MVVLKKVLFEIDVIADERRKIMERKMKAAASRSRTKYNLKSHVRRDRETKQITHIGFTMDRYGVFVEKGVGKGRSIDSGLNNPMPWFNPVLDEQVPLLADELALAFADVMEEMLIH